MTTTNDLQIESSVIPKTIVLKSDDTTLAYILQDEDFGTFSVKETVNAWWADENVIIKLIKAFRRGYNIKQACVYAKISIAQYHYFIEQHPDFSYVKEALEQLLLIEAKDFVASDMKTREGVHWYLERKQRDEFGKETTAAMQGQQSTSFIEESFFDEEGKIRASKKTIKLIEQDDNNPSTTS